MDANALDNASSTSCNLNSPYTDFQGGSGTSAAVQVFAGMMALVNQRWGRQGNANYVLYPLAAKNGASCNSSTAPVTSSSCIFYDITVGNNSVMCQGGSPNCSNTNFGQYGVMASGGLPAYPTTTGYDLATGLGSVNAANLVNNWTSNFTTSTTTLALSTSPATNPITLTHGQPIDFSINVTAGIGTPAGDVSLIAQAGSSASGVTGIGPFTLSGGGISTSTSMLPGGSYTLTAHYAGNGTFAASDSTPGFPVTVNRESSQTEIRFVTFDINTGLPSYGQTTAVYGSPYVLRMDVMHATDDNPCASASTGLISYPCPTGVLTVSPAPTDLNPPPGTVPGSYKLNTQGYAEDEPIQQPPGQYSFVASYAGDSSYTASTSSGLTVTITKATTTINWLTVLGSPVVQAPISLTATLNTGFSNGAPPSGLVQFLDNGNPLGTAALTGATYTTGANYVYSAQATLNTTLPSGDQIITEQYLGDTNYGGSPLSAPTTILVGDFTVGANPSPITISAPGQTANSTVGVTSQYGFVGTVNLSVASGCPLGATCTFSSPSVTFTSPNIAVNDILNITTTASSSAPPALRWGVPPNFPPPVVILCLAAGCLILLLTFNSVTIRRAPAALLFMATVLVLGGWIACGGPSGGGTTAPTPIPAASLSSASLTFSSQNVGTTSAAQTLTLTDTGTAALTISGIGLTGTNAADFSQTSTCSTGSAAIAASSNCAISVKFSPTAAGTRTASISVADNASSSPQTVSLNGTGAQVPTPAGTYPIVLNAVSGSDAHSITVDVVVQ